MNQHWLEETLQKSQERFEKQPQWLQESARNEDSQRRAEAQRLYVGTESRDGLDRGLPLESGNRT